MKILALKFNSNVFHWRLNRLTFNDLTLLIGVSGVGKTQILRGINRLKDITNGVSENGFLWEVEFLIDENQQYLWRGEFETRESSISFFGSSNKKEETFLIMHEELLLNSEQIIFRDQKSLIFKGTPTVKLPPEKSAIYLLREEKEINSVYHNFQKILFDPTVDIDNVAFGVEKRFDKNLYATIETIRAKGGSLRAKTYLAYTHKLNAFRLIEKQFADIFPFVEQVKMEVVPVSQNLNFLAISLKEKNVQHWITEPLLSSGMKRAFWLLAQLHLAADGSVILIDEFENSLGVNCIEEVMASLLGQQRDLQFIVTSHHPYIINNVDYKHWKIITREGGVVTGHDAKEFSLGKSKHEAFMQLINLPSYAEGIAV